MTTVAAPAHGPLAINGGTPVSRTPVPFMLPGLQEADIEAVNKVLRSGMLRAASKCAELETRTLSARDAIHVAVMRRHQISHILTFDAGFDAVAGVERVHA